MAMLADFNPYPLIETSIIFTAEFRSHDKIWSERLAKGPFQENNPASSEAPTRDL